MPLRFPLLGGSLAVDFANSCSPSHRLEWAELIEFLELAGISSSERSRRLLALQQTDPQASEILLAKAERLGGSLRSTFAAISKNQKIAREWMEPINEILQITEGHDEVVLRNGAWQLEFVAREGGLEWLLAAIARSAAEIISEGSAAKIRCCSNPSCRLYFYDTSRTRRRRWCSMATCGNRHKVAAFAKRKSGAATR